MTKDFAFAFKAWNGRIAKRPISPCTNPPARSARKNRRATLPCTRCYLRQRPARGVIQGVQAVGRLDQDTTGLLLLSDDGQFIHRMSSPKKHVPKVYRVTAKHEVSEQQIDRLIDGVVLDDDPKPVRAAACVLVDSCSIDLTLTEGKYHQVKRMLAAVGNRVEGLHRHSIGRYILPADLAPGQWRWLSETDLESLQRTA